MENKTKVLDLDFVFISYKEPNCEENYADLLNKVPWAKRVHGVKGFDNAHKAAAEKAETDFFISVDGDNIIDESFLLQTMDWFKTDPKFVHRWRARNSVNGLVYGNGGIVGWHKETCLDMKTHENSDVTDQKSKIDFCWTVPHANLHNCYSTTVINSSPQQAFLAGYREGAKLSLDRGVRVLPSEFTQKIVPSNMKKLLTWMTVGADVDNGEYAILGARVGCYDTVVADENLLKVRDLELLTERFTEHKDDIKGQNLAYKESLKQRLGIEIAELDRKSSKFFKFIQPTHKNTGVQTYEHE